MKHLFNFALGSLLVSLAIPITASAQRGYDNHTYRGGLGGGHPPVVTVPPPYHPAPPPRYSTYHPPFWSHAPAWPHRTYAPPPPAWRSGRWVHERHGDRFGWWWVSALGWSLFSAPVYPYPQQTTIIYTEPSPGPVIRFDSPSQLAEIQAAQSQLPPPPTSSANVVAADPVPGTQTPPSDGRYYFCESSQLYYPYARSCSERWKIVPGTPN